MSSSVAQQPEAAEPSLREAMRHVAGSVSIVTAGTGNERTGLTATSAISLSLVPPTMLVCVNRGASAAPVIGRHRHFCVNVLAAHHRPLAERFAGKDGVKGAERYAGATWIRLATGALALDDALAAIDCEVDEMIERHSHTIVIGTVRALCVRGGEPLVYGRGQYGTFAHA